MRMSLLDSYTLGEKYRNKTLFPLINSTCQSVMLYNALERPVRLYYIGEYTRQVANISKPCFCIKYVRLRSPCKKTISTVHNMCSARGSRTKTNILVSVLASDEG